MGLAQPEPVEDEERLAGLLVFLQAGIEAEEAVSDVVEALTGSVLDLIRDRELDILARSNTVASVTHDIHKIYSTIDVRYDPGDDDDQTTAATATDSQQRSSVPGIPIQEQERQHQQQRQPLPSKLSSFEFEFQVAGTTRPSPEPQPATIDRWARGWIMSRSTKARGQDSLDRMSDDGSDGSRSVRSTPSIRSMRSACALGTSASRPRMARQQKVQQEAVPKPFPLGPELEEGQRDPPEGGNMPLDNQGRDRNGRGDSLSWSGEGGKSGEGVKKGDIGNAIKDLGGREWTIDAAGELLVLDRPQGDTLPGTLVSASYAFRDVVDDCATTEVGGAGGDAATDEWEARRTGMGGRGANKRSSISSCWARDTSRASVSRRASGRRISRRYSRRGANNRFFALEPTLQPNLTTSLGRPGPGVSVCDGNSIKEGPEWPQDPNHMSWGEYRQRQRKTDSMSSLNAFGGNNNTDETDVSTLGFSLGSIQSAPAQIAQRETLSQNSAGGGSGCGGHNRGQNSRAGTAGIGSGSRGHSFTAFDNIDPLDGGVRVARATSSPPRNMQSARFGKGYRAPGPLSPLSMSVGDDGAGAGGGGAAGPEWIGDDDDSRDPHLQLLQEPEWKTGTQGQARKAGLLPKIKQHSRERPLTHERPNTRNPRDPPNVPARSQAHSSPKKIGGSGSQQPASWEGRQVTADDSDSIGGSTSFSSLPMSLMGWGADGAAIGRSGGMKSEHRRAEGTITMNKPRELIAQGFLR